MLVTIKIDGYSSFELALVHWYDFCYKNDVRTTNAYNFVSVESIIELIQVVKRAEKQNEYFVNIYMF